MTTYTKKFKEFIPEWNPESDDYIVGYRNLDDSEIRIPLLAVDNSITANKYIRKDIDDYANGIIRFNKGFTVSNKVMSTIYLQGLDGWMGTQKGDFEMNSLILREFLEVPELRKNKITVMGNQFWFTDSAMVKVANATGSDNYDIYFKLEDEEYAPFELNDIIKGIYHYNNGFWTVYLKVYELIVNPDTGGEIGVKAHSMNGRDPRQSMLLARMNNSNNPERQGSIFADGLRKYIRVLDGYNPDDPTSEGSIKTLKVQIGDLSTITNHPIFGDLEGYGLYADNVYLTGKLIVKNDPNQPGQELGVYRGVWNNQANYYKYDQVTYKGSLFTSKQIDNIGHIPTGNVDDLWWELTVAKGEDGTSAESNIIIELTNDNHNIPTDSEGKNPSYGGAYCTAYVFQGTNNITDLYTISATVEAPVTSQQLQIVQNDNTVTITHISDDIDAAAIKFTATAVGYPTVTRTWNVSKVKSGTPGEPATAYWIVTDSPVIKKYVFNVNDSEVIRYEPSPFVVRAFAQTGQENIRQFDGYFRIKYGTQVNIVAGSVYQFTPQADVDNYTIEFFLEQGLYTLLDKEIITVVEDGRDGDTPDWNIFIFKKGPEQPSAPTFTTPPSSYPSDGWYDYPTSDGIWWMSTAVVNGNSKTIASWSVPVKTTGEDGLNGADGSNGGYVDFKYAVSTSHNTPPSIVKTDRQPDGWSDVPPTVTSGLFLWMVNAFINPDNTLNGVWSDPMRISGETGPEGPRGPQGLHGNDGLQGPSIAFGGNWSDTTQYYGYADTQTCVYYGGKYYYTKTVSPDLSPLTIPSGAENNPASANGKVYWNEFVGQFDNIATGLLLAERIATSELTANKLFIVDRQESTGNIIAADGSIITKEEEKNLDPNQIIGRLTKGWYLDQGVIRSIAVNSDNTPKLILDKDGKITATGVNVTGTVHFENGTIGSLQVFNDSAWTATVNGPYPASSGFYYLRKNQGVTVTPQGHIIGKDYFLTGDSTVGPSVFVGDVYVPGSSVPGTDDSTLTSFLKLFNSLFERVLVNSQYHIKAKLPLFSVGEITAYGGDNMDVPSIWDGIPVDKVTIDLVNGKLTVIPSSHTHIISNITGLQTELDGKSATSHTHTFASITSKPTTVSGYGITDIYTKSKIDGFLALKLDFATFNDLFEKVNTGTTASPVYAIKAKYNFSSEEGITVKNGVVTDTLTASGLATFLKGLRFGDFVTGMIDGSGGAVTVEEKTGKTIMEIDKAILREELVVPKITFNCIDVISGDKANTFAFGTVRSVDTANRIIELDLLEDQLGTLKVNDICRGVFHNLSGGNNTSDSVDANGFLNYAGFATAYFTPSQILLNEPGAMKLKYALQPGTTVHPSSGMNFYAYGNFTDETRQAMTYETRYYTRRLKNVDTWVIDPTRNISMQDGLLEGLTIGGMVMHGYGTFQENTYLSGPTIQFTPSQLEELQGKPSYNVSLSSYERVVKLDSEGNLTSLYEKLNVISGNQNIVSGNKNVVTSVYNLYTRIQAFKGETELLFSESVDKDRYVVTLSAHGCRASVAAGILTITEVTNYEECYVDLKINCEGNAVFDKRFSVVGVRNGADGEGSITADIDNEMQSVASDSEGNVTAGLPLTTVFSMYYGSTKLTLDSLSRGSVPGVTVTTDKDTGIVTVTAITKDAADTLRLPVTGKATYNGVQYERTIHLSINKVRPGAPGENAVIYSLLPSVSVIKRNSSGQDDVANISCKVFKTDGASTSEISSIPLGYELHYKIDSNPSVKRAPGYEQATSGITTKIEFILYKVEKYYTRLDNETVYVVKDGIDGTDGHSPYISENGTWMVWDADQGKYVDSGDPAKGDDGHSPKIQNGTWWVWDAEQGKYVDTGIKARGEDGKPGADGKYTELRYRYAFNKPVAPTGLNPAGWFLSPEPKELSYIRNTGDFVLTDNMYVSPNPAANSTTYRNRVTFVTTYANQVIDLLVILSSQTGDLGIVCPVDVAYTDNVSALWKKSGIVSETLNITIPSSGSHFVDIVYKKDSSGKAGEDCFKYRLVYPRTCWLSTAVIDPSTSDALTWSIPVEFPTDTPGEERIYILAKSHIVVDFPSSDPYADEYIGEAPAYDNLKPYVRGNIVKHNNAYKICTSSCTGITPDTASNWESVGWWTDNPSGSGSEFPYEYQCSRKFVDGKWDNYENTILFTHFAKDGTDGNDGITPVVTQLIPSVTQIGRTMTGSYEPESFTVSHKDTEGTLVKAYMAVWGSNDGNSWTRIGSVENVSSKSINVARYPYKYFVVRTYGTSSASFGSDYLLSTSVSVLHDGEKGESGAQGAMPVYCGFYESGVGYTYTDATRDIINYNIDGGVFTFQVKVYGAVVTTPPTSSTGDANWEPAGKFKFVAMDTALIDGANIAGFMYKNLLMKSRLGLLRGTETDIKDVGESDMQWFKPYLQLDGNAGYIDAMANVRVAYQIIDAGTDLKKNLSWMVLNASGYNRINNLGNPDTGIGLQIYKHELGSQVFIGNFYRSQLNVFLRVQMPKESLESSVYSKVIKIRIDPGKMFRGVIIPDGSSYVGGGVTYVEEDGSQVHYPFILCIYPYSELNSLGTTGANNNIPYYEVVH